MLASIHLSNSLIPWEEGHSLGGDPMLRKESAALEAEEKLGFEITI